MRRVVFLLVSVEYAIGKRQVLVGTPELEALRGRTYPPESSARNELPEAMSWRDVPGYGSLLTASQNQHVPVYCGGCFIFGAYHCLADRVKISRFLMLRSGQRDKWKAPDLIPAHQTYLNCGGPKFGGCLTGGSAPGVWEWTREYGGIPLAGCQPYQAVDGLGCPPENVCRNCMPAPGKAWTERQEKACWAVAANVSTRHPCDGDDHCAAAAYPRIAIADYGALPTAQDVGPQAAAEAIQREIFRAGPVTCNVDATALVDYDGSYVVEDPQGDREASDTDHVIEIVGWGTDDQGRDYWELRNSWGEYWADAGFGKIYRGRNDMLVESGCYWVHPAGWGIPDTEAWQSLPNPSAYDQAAALLFSFSPTHLHENDSSSNILNNHYTYRQEDPFLKTLANSAVAAIFLIASATIIILYVLRS